MTSFDQRVAREEATPQTTVSRRTIVKGAAWSVPIVAAAVAVPAYAASPDCAGTATVTANDYEKGVLTVTLPACARTVSYVVLGGGGGTAQNVSYSGCGAKITGTLAVSGGEVLTLVAGGGGGNRGMAPVRATGWGDGGMGSVYYDTALGRDNFAAGGGGAGSAILLGADPSTSGTPLIVAGGGGGMPFATSWAQSGPDAYWLGANVGWGGSAEPAQDNIGDGGISETPMGTTMTEIARHGVPGTPTAAGAGGLAELSGAPLARGLAGGAASGHDGGDAAAVDVRTDSETLFLSTGGAGGGGGGWYGGGAAATVWTVDKPHGAGGGGAGASNYYGGATPGASANVGSVSIPYPTDVWIGSWDRNPAGFVLGSVTISWS
ncbi:hypothetical protein [Microbacterium sp.]|uniref:hypothetical protein n=1 Tax=Microbacterium sp. TaxID=51671 RepID=UPI0033428DB5